MKGYLFATVKPCSELKNTICHLPTIYKSIVSKTFCMASSEELQGVGAEVSPDSKNTWEHFKGET